MTDFERLLGEHRQMLAGGCSCGFSSPAWRRHLASVLASLPDDRLAEAEAKVQRVETLPAKWRAISDGVLGPGLRAATATLRNELEQPRRGHFVGGLITADNPTGVRFVEDRAALSDGDAT